jgi:hypothetical protein
VIAAAYGGIVWSGVYTKLTTDIPTARNVALVLACVALVLVPFAWEALFF